MLPSPLMAIAALTTIVTNAAFVLGSAHSVLLCIVSLILSFALAKE